MAENGPPAGHNPRPDDGHAYLVVRGAGAGRDRKLHTSEGCVSIQDANNYEEATDEEVRRYGLCDLCTGNYDSSGVDHSYHLIASALDPDTIGGGGGD